MTSKEIKKLAHRVEGAIVRNDLHGNSWVTIWYGQIADTILITPENIDAVREMLLMVKDKKHGN